MSVYNNMKTDMTLLEFDGDPKKNQEYLNAVDKAEEALLWLKEDSEDSVKKLENWKEKLKAVKNEKDLKKYNNDFKNFVEDEIKNWNSSSYKSKVKTHYTALNNLINLSKKFNNKYSSILMEKKKEIDMRFSKIADDCFSLVYPWCHFQNDTMSGKKVDEFNEAIEKARRVERSYFEGENSLMKYLAFYYQESVGAAFNAFRFAGHMRHVLGLDKEDKMLYKIINKIFK